MNFARNRFWFGLLGILCVILAVLLVRTGLSDGEASSQEEEPAVTEAPSAGLQTNAYPKVNALIEKYYTAMTNGSNDTLQEIVDPFSESDEATVTRKSEFIESYQNITCYTEDGADQDTYIVFAYYEIKFPNVDTLVPGLETLIVCTNSDGELYINKDQSRLSDEMNEQITTVMARDDVVALFAMVDEAFAEAILADENVRSLCEQMGLDTSSVLEAAATEAVTEETTVTAEPVGDVKAERAVVTELTIYESADESSTVLGTAAVGTYLWVDSNLDGGFSYVDQDGLTGYVKTEGLASYELVDEEISGTLNYYSSCSSSAAAAGTITSDSSYYCTLKYSNGWLQIIVDGTKVYIKESDLGTTVGSGEEDTEEEASSEEETAEEEASDEETAIE